MQNKDTCPCCGKPKSIIAALCRACYQETNRVKRLCPHCGKERINLRAKLCRKCLLKTWKLSGSPERTCPQCGNPKDSRSKVCRHCFWKWKNTPGVVIANSKSRSHHPKKPCPQCGHMMRADSILCAKCSEGQNMHFARERTQDPDTKLKRVQSRLSGANPYSTWTTYNGRVYRSRWEARVAFYLDSNDLAFQYEQYVIPYHDATGKRHHYIPDFWIPDWHVFIEVKGYLPPEQAEKMQCVYAEHPEFTILMFDQNVMAQIPDLPDMRDTQLPLPF